MSDAFGPFHARHRVLLEVALYVATAVGAWSVRFVQDDADRAHDLAVRVRAEAAKGTNFGILVRRYSKYEGPTGEDGDVNFMPLPSLPPNIRAGVDSLEIGQVSDVLPNQAGFNIFKVTDRKPERDYTVDEIRDDLPEAVAQAQSAEKYEAFVKTLRAKAQIEYRSY